MPRCYTLPKFLFNQCHLLSNGKPGYWYFEADLNNTDCFDKPHGQNDDFLFAQRVVHYVSCCTIYWNKICILVMVMQHYWFVSYCFAYFLYLLLPADFIACTLCMAGHFDDVEWQFVLILFQSYYDYFFHHIVFAFILFIFSFFGLSLIL